MFLYNRAILDFSRYEELAKRAERFQCRKDPFSDSVNKFNLSEQGAAWSVMYAEHTVIVVSRDGWKPSQQLVQFAKQRKVRIVVVPLSTYNPEFIKRLQTMYFTSPQLKKQLKRDEIVERFID